VPDVKSALAAQELEVTSGTPDQFGDYSNREIAKISRIATAAGVKAD
jgi:tripartite-type tricarboxylate transporter receptor subunit TctC